jgi:hypothetical protein
MKDILKVIIYGIIIGLIATAIVWAYLDHTVSQIQQEQNTVRSCEDLSCVASIDYETI